MTRKEIYLRVKENITIDIASFIKNPSGQQIIYMALEIDQVKDLIVRHYLFQRRAQLQGQFRIASSWQIVEQHS